jgi:uncharacterized repeat protein (TIGR02543 family)
LKPNWRKRLAILATTALAGAGLVVSPVSQVESAQAAACSANYVMPVHGPVAYYDTGFEAKYLGYKVSPTSNISDLNVRVSIGSNSVLALESNQPNLQNHGSVNSGQSIYSYFLSDINLSSSAASVITVEVLDGASVICDYTDTVGSKASTIAANSNKITSASVTNAGQTVTVGSRSVVTVRGETGNLGAGPQAKNDINLTPVAKIGTFNPSAWQLTRVEFFSETAGCNAGQPIANRLYIASDTSPSSADCGGPYRANYTFEVRPGFSGANTSSIDAFGYIASGTQMKHTDPYSQAITLPGVNTATGSVLVASEPNLQNLNATYAITYSNTGADSGTPPASTTGNGTVSVAGAGSLVKSGHTFGGWLIGGTTYQQGANYNLSASVSASPVWISNSATYTITYSSSNETSGSVPASQVGVGTVTLDSNSGSLARTNYVFGGWVIGSTTFAAGASYNLVANVTAIAVWTPTPKVITFSGNSQSAGTPPANLSGSGNVTLPGNPGGLTKTGSTFAGWATTNNATTPLPSNYNLSADITLYAVWLPEYVITYAGNGETGGSVPSSQSGSGLVTLSGNVGNLVKTGFIFDGWTITGQPYVAGSNYNLAANVTASAIWTPVYLITFAGNGNDGGNVPSPVSGNGILNLPSNPGSLTKSGHTFLGWGAQNSTTALASSYNLTADVTLYAVWQAVQVPATNSTPCVPTATTVGSQGLFVFTDMVGGFLAEVIQLAAKGSQWAMNRLLTVPVLSALADNQVAAVAPALTLDGYQQIVRDSAVFSIAAAAKPKPASQLSTSDVTIVPGADPNTIEIQSTDGSSLQLLASDVIDYKTQTLYSGSDFNNPATWQALGYGVKCWKLEPFSDSDYFYTLPNPIQLPGGTEPGQWRYSHVVVKAGSLTASSDSYQTDTVFAAPKAGSQVWADINGNGVFDPGGKTGDKSISHIIVCITNEAIKPAPTATAEVTPTPAPSSSASPSPTPSPSSSPTVTPSPSVTAAPTTAPIPTPTPTQVIVGCPEPTPPTASPKPLSDPRIQVLVVDPSKFPTPTPSGSATPSPSATPTPSGSATPTPSGSATPSPSATPTPSGSATPSPSATPTPESTLEPVDPALIPGPVSSTDSSLPCKATKTYGFAFLLSNGESTSCYRVTAESVLGIASFGGLSLMEEGNVGSGAAESELANTGFESQLWIFVALLLMGLGATAVVYARRRD